MANTGYLEIMELVMAIIRDYRADQIFDAYNIDGLYQLLKPYFKIASAELAIVCPSVDFSRDDEILTFNRELNDTEQLIFAKYILIGYLTQEVNDILQMKLHLQDGDFKTHAARNNLESKMDLLETLKEEVIWNVNKLGYNNKNVWG